MAGQGIQDWGMSPCVPVSSPPTPSIQREVHPLLERLDPLHFGLDPEDHIELDKLTPWETRGQGLAFPPAVIGSRGSSQCRAVRPNTGTW